MKVFGQIPGPVIALDLGGGEEVATAERGAARGHAADIAEGAHFALNEGLYGVARYEGDRARGRKIADIGEIGPLAVIDPLQRFGNHEVEIEITLAMAMRAHVDRHAVDETGEIRAVIEVEAAQEILVRLARSRMLRGDDAGHILHQFTRPADRHIVEIGIADGALRSRNGDADLFDRAAIYDDGIAFGSRIGTGGYAGARCLLLVRRRIVMGKQRRRPAERHRTR